MSESQTKSTSALRTRSTSIDWAKLMADMEQPGLYSRLPGRFRRWEVGSVIDPDGDFRVTEGGSTSDNTRLYLVYRRDPNLHEDLQTVLRFLCVSPKSGGDSTAAKASTLSASSPPEAPGTIGMEAVDPVDPDDPVAPPCGADAQDRAALANPAAGERGSGAIPQTLRLENPMLDQQLVQLPGLFGRREIGEVIGPDAHYHIEPFGTLQDGTDVFVVFEKRQKHPGC